VNTITTSCNYYGTMTEMSQRKKKRVQIPESKISESFEAHCDTDIIGAFSWQ